LYLKDRPLQWALLVFMVLYYGATLSDVGLGPAAPLQNLTFNSMLQHLLHWRFDVDPGIIGEEGFLRNGYVYSYWGVWCAFIRLPLFLVRWMNVDVTTWSCLVAVCIAGMMKVRAVLLIRRHGNVRPATEWVFALMLAYIVFGGSAVGYLKSSVYQEVVFWAAAFGAAFVYFAVKGVVSGEFSGRTLSWMAALAGLALLTRVSTGIGLCVAFGLLLIVLLIEDASAVWRMLVPVGVLAGFLIVTGFVNYYRWGHVTTFADYTLYLGDARYLDRMPRTRLYGLFNARRIPFGFLYYFFPVWAFRGPSGHFFFAGMSARLMDAVELPPSSFFLTDLLPIFFIAWLVYAIWTRRSVVLRPMGRWLAVAAGLAVPCILMLTAISMNYRYRMEFYPEMDLLALLGLYAVVTNEGLLGVFHRWRRWMAAALIVSIAGAFALMVLYKLTDWGPSQQYLQDGVVRYYAQTMGL
jgi:hypothetical protein